LFLELIEMTTTAYLGNEYVFQVRNTTVSPIAYQTMNQVFDIGTIGELKPQVDITVLTSTAREYRGGLPDGTEIKVQMNFIANDLQWEFVKAAYTADSTPTFRLLNSTASPNISLIFTAKVLGWDVSAPVGDRSVATFTLKVTGSITVAT
jgi:hypothetical protein